MYQSIRQLNNQSIDQSVNRSHHPSLSRSTHQSITISLPMDKLLAGWFSVSVIMWYCWLLNRSITWNRDRLLPARMIFVWDNRLIWWSINQSVLWLLNIQLSDNQSINQRNEWIILVFRLTGCCHQIVSLMCSPNYPRHSAVCTWMTQSISQPINQSLNHTNSRWIGWHSVQNDPIHPLVILITINQSIK